MRIHWTKVSIDKTSAEREREHLDTSIEEVDRERSIDDRRRLSHQLIQPLLAHRSVATLVDVETVSSRRWLPSTVTRKRTGLSDRDGPMTRCTSRAWNR